MEKRPWFPKFMFKSIDMNQQEFVTLYGKAIVERDILFIRSFDVPVTRTNLFRIAYGLCFLTLFVLAFFKDEGPKKYVSILVWGFLLLMRLPQWFDILFIRSYANRIPLNRIKSITSETD